MEEPRPVAWMTRGVGEFDPLWVKSAKRFQSNVIDNGAGECSGWKGRIDPAGYARYGDGTTFGTVYAHLIAFRLGGGFCPEGWEVDHACHSADPTCRKGNACPHRHCTTFAHLRAVPLKVNRDARRYPELSPECPNGHLRTPENTYTNRKTGATACRSCVRAATATWLAKGDNRERQNRMRNERR